MRAAAGTTQGLTKRAAVILLVAGGLVASGAMLAVMLSMSVQLTLAVFPGLNGLVHSPTAASSAAAASAAAVSMGDVGTTVGNAMTAVGTAVAAVALILSVGTTWFALRLKEMESMTLKLEEADKRYEQRLAEMSAALSRNELDRTNREEVRQLLLDAIFALRKWVDRNGAAVTRYSVLADLSAHLEMLMSQSPEQRQRSYAELTKFLPKAPTTALAPIDTYAKRCHQLHGGSDCMHGVWCDIFSAVEREAYVKARAGNRPFY